MRSLSQWPRIAERPSFDYSLALKMLNFFGPDVREGLDSVGQKAPPLPLRSLVLQSHLVSLHGSALTTAASSHGERLSRNEISQ